MLSNLNRRRFLRTAAGVLVPAPFAIGQSLRNPAFVARLTNAVSFTKDTIAGMMFWFDASTLSDGDGNAVGTWADQSGNGRNLTAAGSLRPTLRTTGGPNSKPACQFAGAQGMATPSINFNYTAYTVFCVAKTSNTTSTQVIGELSVNINANSAFFCVYDAGNTFDVTHQIGSGSSYSQWISTNAVGTSWHVLCGKGDTTLSTIEAKGYVDGSSVGTHPLNNNMSGSFGNFPFYVGSRAQSSLFLTGHIAELICYNTALDDTNRVTVETYLKNKYTL